MSNEYPLPSYLSIEETLQILQIPLTAAECHGLMCGLYCTSINCDAILANLYAQSDQDDTKDPLIETSRYDLQELCQMTAHQFSDANFGFQLLIPNDEQSLAERSAAIGLWCQGFISGLGEGNIDIEQDFKSELQELIADLTEIGKIDNDSINNDEEDEVNFTELVEYVRIAALTIHADLILDNKNVVQDLQSETIH